MRARRMVGGWAAVAVAVLGLAATGCGREPGFPDRTARLTVDGETTVFELDGCLLDGTTFVMAGSTDDGEVLQATVGVQGDLSTGVPDSSGFTAIDATGAGIGAFGAEAWSRRGQSGAPPGSVGTALIRGARVQVSGEAEALDVDDQPIGGEQAPFSLDARCDADDSEGGG